VKSLVVRLLAAVVVLSTAPTAQEPTFRARTNLVRVDVLASKGRQPVTDLTPADFEIRDNGAAQQIEFMRFEELPLNVVVVCDTSASVAGEDATNVRQAVQALIPSLRRGDRTSMITFGGRVTERLKLTEDVGQLANVLDNVQPDGLTTVIDAVYAALTLVGDEPGRSLVLVFSDGIDTVSWLTLPRLLETVKGSPAVVYAASVGDDATEMLREVADTSGGRHVAVRSTRNLEATFSEFLGEFRKRYVLGYEPTSTAPGWHRLDIKVKRSGVDVRARPGYQAAREVPQRP
jgi:VWFA-related protein